MIHESYYWKDDLLKLSRKLESRLLQTKWGERNLYTIEKEIFIGFYSVRKLIESRKTSNSIKSKFYDIKEFPHNGNKGSVTDPYRLEDFVLKKVKSLQKLNENINPKRLIFSKILSNNEPKHSCITKSH